MAGATLGATAVFAANAEAATYTVNSTADDGTGTCNPSPGVCTLRDAVTTANDTVGSDTVEFSGVSGTIALDPTQGVIGISDPAGLNINGPGPGTLAVSGGNETAIFGIDSGDGAVSISGLTLTAGSSTSNGGAIYASAPLTLTNVTISGNTATDLGGGVYSEDELTISGSTITGNAASDGGGIAAFGKYDFVIENSTISDNAAVSGGGIFAFGGSLSVTQSTISGNTSSQVGGGIISLNTKYGTTIDNSTIAQNAAADSGGGIFLAQYDSGDQSGTAINSTIVADNTAGGAPNDLFMQAGAGFNNTFSLIENPGEAPLLGSHALITGVDPQLGALANNGGPTQTMLPSNTSPVIDQGSNAQASLATDQRGLARTFNRGQTPPAGGDSTDIGAVELQQIPPGASQPAGGSTPPPPGPAIVVTTQCRSRRHFTIRLRERRARLIRSARVFVRGRRVAVVRRRSDHRLVAVVDLRGLPKGTYRVVITARLRDGRRARWVRSYRTCIPPLPPSNDLGNPRAL